MIPTKLTLAAVATMIFGSASGHMLLASPIPFETPDGWNGPVDDQYPFPCKGQYYVIQSMNNWVVGSQQTLAFRGTATHSGGSCQVSVSDDPAPNAQSKWKVIYSIEGGCPSDAEGNNGPLNTYQFTVPKQLPNGNLTMAWTWFNKSGNREFYMNCAPITVTGGSADTTGFENLPDMAIGNIPGSSCHTVEDYDYIFPDPGQWVFKSAATDFQPLCSGNSTVAKHFEA